MPLVGEHSPLSKSSSGENVLLGDIHGNSLEIHHPHDLIDIKCAVPRIFSPHVLTVQSSVVTDILTHISTASVTLLDGKTTRRRIPDVFEIV